MNRDAVIGLVVVVVILIAAMFLYQRQQAAAAAAAARARNPGTYVAELFGDVGGLIGSFIS